MYTYVCHIWFFMHISLECQPACLAAPGVGLQANPGCDGNNLYDVDESMTAQGVADASSSSQNHPADENTAGAIKQENPEEEDLVQDEKQQDLSHLDLAGGEDAKNDRLVYWADPCLLQFPLLSDAVQPGKMIKHLH